MEECYYKKRQVPAFGSWDWNDNLPFTQCFETARQAGFLRCSYSESHQDRDLYVTGDLYDNNVVTPTMIVVPAIRAKVVEHNEKETRLKNWISDVDSETPSSTPPPRRASKLVDEDLYKISPGLLYAKAKKKRRLCFFSSCLLPTCIA